jgi:hypothetical protein
LLQPFFGESAIVIQLKNSDVPISSPYSMVAVCYSPSQTASLGQSYVCMPAEDDLTASKAVLSFSQVIAIILQADHFFTAFQLKKNSLLTILLCEFVVSMLRNSVIATAFR